MPVSPLIGASWDRGVPVGAGIVVVDVVGDAGGTFAAGLLIMPLRLSEEDLGGDNHGDKIALF